MTKRTFVLFLCLISLLSNDSFSISGQAKDTTVSEIISSQFSHQNEVIGSTDKNGFEFAYDDNKAIVSADECEWRDNINYLLRLRSSSFRFIGIENSGFFTNYLLFNFPIFQYLRCIFPVRLYGVKLPDYYSYLHRLCPF